VKATSGVRISCNFDSGNIEVIDCSDLNNIELKLKQEQFTEYDQKRHSQWFHFQISSAKGKSLRMRIVNAGEARYNLYYHIH